MHYLGEGGDKNAEAARDWFQQAAEQGSPQAYYNLGNMYQNALGVDQDFEVAANWYQQPLRRGTWMDLQYLV